MKKHKSRQNEKARSDSNIMDDTSKEMIFNAQKFKSNKRNGNSVDIKTPNKSKSSYGSITGQQTGSETNTLDQSRIRSLLVKGFTVDEVKKMTGLNEKQIKPIAESIKGGDINQGSIDLYNELQRDLSKLVLLETQEGTKRDTNAILNAIKLQVELQEKKLQLNATITGKSFSADKVSKDYIGTRDKEILEMRNNGSDLSEIAKITGMSPSSINQALDRATLALPDDLIGINPSIITETRGMPLDARIDILRKAKEQKLNRNQVRALTNQLKNETR